jgi:fructokinase
MAELSGQPLIFGEVLFDTFPDGGEVPGGAPFNVAWHLRGFGLDPLMVSRIGKDERGGRILSLMSRWDMDTAGMQEDAGRPTGVVSIRLRDGEPAFDILPDQAYDHIAPDGLEKTLAGREVGLLYHGSLAVRSGPSRQALDHLLTVLKPPAFFDVNFRDPWVRESAVRRDLQYTTRLKLNRDELSRLVPAAGDPDPPPEACADILRKEYGLKMTAVTLGAKGAVLLDSEGKIFQEEPPLVENLADTVGAGDALSAVLILGIIQDWPLDLTLKRAVHFSAALCGIQGAIPEDKNFYAAFLDRWAE